MIRFGLWFLLLLLAALLGAGAATAQSVSGRPDSGLDELKYRAIHGKPPPPPEEKKAAESKQEGKAESGDEQEQKPRYRFGNDPLLNPPGRTTPVAPAPAAPSPAAPSSPPSYPSAPSRPGGLGYTNSFSAGQAGQPLSGLPRREIRVAVVDDQGHPVPLAQVSISTRQQPFFNEGFTDEQGNFSTWVPCYLPGREAMLAHTLRVTSDSGFLERLVVTRQGSCGIADQMTLILADPNRLNKMLQEYRERQDQYELEEEEQKAKEDKEQEALAEQYKKTGQGKPPGKKTLGGKK